MRLTSVDALATRQALNRNSSADLAFDSCSATLGGVLALLDGKVRDRVGQRVASDSPGPRSQTCQSSRVCLE